ncbi:unnamed protein product [Adineta ricciae]|uniref:Uncharacterized protein n=1 Tax=Adineta ricciae TaxID=249248 RepID=A0A814IKB0_ADIRI|nr:unnamed protein product [Adineta ricciae]CAF1024632.1 unnamed protein product [Adineta ricciae]
MSYRQRSSTKRKSIHENPVPAANEPSAINDSISTSYKRQKVVTEKRLRRYRATMTAATRDRIERALNQRLYLLAISKSADGSIYREYKVLGQTANVYTVAITHIPSCTCPDYGKGNLCKHIIFVLHRVLKVSRASPLIYQQALLTIELHDIFSKADSQNNDSSILAEQPILEAYHAKTGDPGVILTIKDVEQKPIEADDECPICFESLLGEETNIIFCSRSCGNNIHKNCFDKWRQAKSSMNESVTCPFCRVEWKSVLEKHENSQGYLNLAAYATTDHYEDDDDDDDDDENTEDWMFYNYW